MLVSQFYKILLIRCACFRAGFAVLLIALALPGSVYAQDEVAFNYAAKYPYVECFNGQPARINSRDWIRQRKSMLGVLAREKGLIDGGSVFDFSRVYDYGWKDGNAGDQGKDIPDFNWRLEENPD